MGSEQKLSIRVDTETARRHVWLVNHLKERMDEISTCAFKLVFMS